DITAIMCGIKLSRHLDYAGAAIDNQSVSENEGRIARAKPKDRFCDLLGLRNSADGMNFDHILKSVSRASSKERSFYPAGADGVDPDVFRGVFKRQGFGEAQDRVLARAIESS